MRIHGVSINNRWSRTYKTIHVYTPIWPCTIRQSPFPLSIDEPIYFAAQRYQSVIPFDKLTLFPTFSSMFLSWQVLCHSSLFSKCSNLELFSSPEPCVPRSSFKTRLWISVGTPHDATLQVQAPLFCHRLAAITPRSRHLTLVPLFKWASTWYHSTITGSSIHRFDINWSLHLTVNKRPRIWPNLTSTHFS